MKVFTIESGHVTEGAPIDSLTIKGANVTIPAIIVGEEGRGRERGVVPVELTPFQHEEWKGDKTRINCAKLGTTKAGKPKLFSRQTCDETDFVIVVFITKIGFRGGNSHTGDRVAEKYTLDSDCHETANQLGVLKDFYTRAEAVELSPKVMEAKYGSKGYEETAGFECRREFLPFPGEIIARGMIAQGDAGRMGCGEQIVAIMPKNTVFRTSYSGRLYGNPNSHYYMWDGQQMIGGLTWDERQTSDLF